MRVKRSNTAIAGKTKQHFETDEDGYYEIDEITAGKITVGCHAPGYLVPDKVIADPKPDESLVIDCILVPVNVALN